MDKEVVYKEKHAILIQIYHTISMYTVYLLQY